MISECVASQHLGDHIWAELYGDVIKFYRRQPNSPPIPIAYEFILSQPSLALRLNLFANQIQTLKYLQVGGKQ